MKSLDQIVAMRQKGMTMEAIGAVCGCSKQNIQYLLDRAEIKKETVAKFRTDKSAILEEKQKMLLEALDDEKVSKMSGKDLVISAAVLIDKQRLIDGHSASGGNISLLVIANKVHAEYQSMKGGGSVVIAEAEVVSPPSSTMLEEADRGLSLIHI